MLEPRWTSVVRRAPSTPDAAQDARPAGSSSPFGHAPALFDIAPTNWSADSSRTYVRPQFALGTSSDTLRSLLQFVGVNARHCVMPLMKMHSNVAGGSSKAKASISASCSTG